MKNPILNVRDLTKVYGTSTPLKVELLDGTTGLANQNIVFEIHGVKYTRVTNFNGITSLNINLNPGTYPCTVKYLGDSTYNPITREVLVRVLSNNTPPKETKRPEDYFEVNKVRLYIVMSNGFSVKPGQNIKETQLLQDTTTHNTPTFYFNSGFDGDEFEVTAYIRESDFYNGEQVMSLLNGWNKMNTVVTVVTDSMIVANGKYTLQIKDKKQTRKGYSLWKLRFKQYYENSFSFESLYDLKISTLSAIDQLLLKQVNGINKKSPVEVIRALQKKLNSIGYGPGYLTNYYEGWINTAVYRFMYEQRGDVSKRPAWDGVDYETITELIEYSYGGS